MVNAINTNETLITARNDKVVPNHEPLTKLFKQDSVSINDSDDVTLSHLSEQISMVKTASVPEINQDKVFFLKEQISSGQYKIAPEHIAKKMLADIA